jgi:ABC-type glutathione transport system ATPase component
MDCFADEMKRANYKSVRIDVVNLSYNVEVNKIKKILLTNINFAIEPGTLCALIGESLYTFIILIGDKHHR